MYQHSVSLCWIPLGNGFGEILRVCPWYHDLGLYCNFYRRLCRPRSILAAFVSGNFPKVIMARFATPAAVSVVIIVACARVIIGFEIVVVAVVA